LKLGKNGKKDGDGGDTGISYLDLADFLVRNGAQTNEDLEQVWRRIVQMRLSRK
jgi:serine/threonine-protein kinase HipA